ncbi:MAG: rRNA pseudouridine synthase [bacterium]|nr:rRNA pseudouridine synthase [bacterium]
MNNIALVPGRLRSSTKMANTVRLNKLIAERTGLSRRAADTLIESGRVQVNRRIARAGEQINPDNDIVLLDSKPLPAVTPILVFAFHKPRGYVTTLQTGYERGQPISKLLPPGLGLKPAGRLDAESEGLLIVTNDGDLIYRITHPSQELAKEYRVTLNRPLHRLDFEELSNGVELEDGWCRPDWLQVEAGSDVSVQLHEGRKREVRRMFQALGYRVERLIRVRIGAIQLGNLPAGELRTLTKDELTSISGRNRD